MFRDNQRMLNMPSVDRTLTCTRAWICCTGYLPRIGHRCACLRVEVNTLADPKPRTSRHASATRSHRSRFETFCSSLATRFEIRGRWAADLACGQLDGHRSARQTLPERLQHAELPELKVGGESREVRLRHPRRPQARRLVWAGYSRNVAHATSRAFTTNQRGDGLVETETPP